MLDSNESELEGKSLSYMMNIRTGVELWDVARKKIRTFVRIGLSGIQTSTNRVATEIEFALSESKDLGILFHPRRGFKAYWNILMSFILFYSIIISPYALAFNYTKNCNNWCSFDLMTDFILLIDVLLKFNTAVYDWDKTLIKSHKEIATHYIKTWFFFDLASALPYELISFENDYQQTDLHIINIITRLLYGKKMFIAARFLRLFKIISSFKYCKLIKRLQNYMMLSHSTMRLIQALAKILISVHIMACFWAMAAKLSNYSPDSWTYRYNPSANDDGNIYLLAVYYALTTLATIGYGDISPKTSYEMCLAIIWMFTAVYFLSFNISSLSSIFSEANYKKNVLMQRMAMLEDYTKSQRISHLLKKKMKREIKDKVSRMNHSAEDREEIISYLPIELKYEVAMTMHKGVINEFPFFKEKEHNFIANIFPKLYSKILNIGEVIFMQSQISEEIFFISKGRVNLIYGEENQPFRVISLGQYFGDYDSIFEKRRAYGAICRQYTHLLVMSSDLTQRFRRDFPSIWFEFKQISEHRHHMNMRALAEMIVIRRINREGRMSKISMVDIQKLIKVQMQLLNFRSKEVNFDELRKKNIGNMRKAILEQREILFRILTYLNNKKCI
ncbi:hypothetical protein SteCoe_19178 [Stentor coeruleus]|uniref:Cyclic nucleotide-binding domain-containing protein n=1 Tax=Stentor coeruleus TaxID=5963 RepID=A0A1R2BUV5_9CILI|nr:hypothetical protein SteCoe_19178 [Stentor coeruleus]